MEIKLEKLRNEVAKLRKELKLITSPNHQITDIDRYENQK